MFFAMDKQNILYSK